MPASHAQVPQKTRPDLQDTSFQADPQFDYMALQAVKYMKSDFNFNRFRATYMRTSQYDPIADDLVEQMLKLSYTAQTDSDDRKASNALAEYRFLLMDHLANLRVVAQALALAKLDKRFGSPRFFAWMRDGLVQDVLKFGDGKTMDTAYTALTLSEETILFGQLGLKPIETKSEHIGARYFNFHEVEDIRTGQRWTLVVNTTKPMKFLERKEQRNQGGFSIKRQ